MTPTSGSRAAVRRRSRPRWRIALPSSTVSWRRWGCLKPPGAAAAKAGLKVGDIITKFNGTSLAGAQAEDEDESGPSAKLVELARKLEPGDTVQVEYRRGGDAKKAALVAEDLGGSFRMEMPNMTMAMPRIAPAMPGWEGVELSFGTPSGDLERVNLNPDLGEYFGTKEGVLVVKAPGDSSLPVRSGDVILSIAGRKPTSPSHAMRILHRSEEHTSELQSHHDLVCRLLLAKKNTAAPPPPTST